MKLEPLVAEAIVPLVQRHTGDASFYWAQRDGSINSPHMGLARLQHVDRLLQAHLDGLVVAGAEGWQQALQALKRWQGPGEAFVCAVLSLNHGDGTRLQVLWPMIAASPERLARGLVSALAWVAAAPGKPRTPWIEHWLAHAELPLLKAIALRAATCVGMPQEEAAYAANAAPEVELRVASCKALALLPDASHARHALHQSLQAPELRVRGAAACSLLNGKEHKEAALATLLAAVLECSQALAEAQGREKPPIERRLLNWLRVLAVSLPMGHSAISMLLEQLSDHHALEFIAWHGDICYAPLLLEMASQADLAQGALWALDSLTGQGAALSQQHEDASQPISAKARHFSGLPYPDIKLWRHWWAEQGSHLPRHKRLLNGRILGDEQALDQSHCHDLLLHGSQRSRHLAALLRARDSGRASFNIRERAYKQAITLGVPWHG